MTGCRSSKIVLPPKPQRIEQKAPETVRDYAELVLYYETLVEEWELWADTVSSMID